MMSTIIKRNDSKSKCKSNNNRDVNIIYYDQMNQVREKIQETNKVYQYTDHNNQIESTVNCVHLPSPASTCDIVVYNVTRLIQFFNHQHLMSQALTSLFSTACHRREVSDASTINQASFYNRRNDARDRKYIQSPRGNSDINNNISKRRKDDFKCPHDINETSVRASLTTVTDKCIIASHTLHKISKSQGDHCDNNLHKQITTPSCSSTSTSSSPSCNQSSRYSEKLKQAKLVNCKLLVHFILISFLLTLNGINSFPETSREPRIYKYQSIKVLPSLPPSHTVTTLSFAFQSNQETSLLSSVSNNYYTNGKNTNNNALMKTQVSSPLPPYSSTATSSVSTANVTVNPQPDYCKVCRCSNKKDSLYCKTPGDLTSIPLVKKEIERHAISEIIIENQPKLTQLTTVALSGYPNIEKMYVIHFIH